jgi:hypothetical protein
MSALLLSNASLANENPRKSCLCGPPRHKKNATHMWLASWLALFFLSSFYLSIFLSLSISLSLYLSNLTVWSLFLHSIGAANGARQPHCTMCQQKSQFGIQDRQLIEFEKQLHVPKTFDG